MGVVGEAVRGDTTGKRIGVGRGGWGGDGKNWGGVISVRYGDNN